MWKKLGAPVPIDASQVVIGLYIWLDLRWDEHPFVSSRFMVKTSKQISIIQSLETEGRLYYDSEQSTAQPGPLISKPLLEHEAKAAEEQAAKEALIAEVLALEKAKVAKQKALRDAALRADQAWANAARATKTALNELPRSPKVAGKQLMDLSSEAASLVSKNREVLLHLLGDQKEQGPQFHGLNCMTLAMLIGKSAGMNERALADLSLAALAHDAGESQIPQQILKSTQRKKHEEDFFRQHVNFSTKFAEESCAFSPDALAMIADHHEAIDGSGWPRGKKGEALSVGARILTIVDRYDTLCTPDMPKGVPMMPAEALATMFRHESTRLDSALLSLMIKLLGVFPPGTAVQLSDGSLALVIAPGANSLKPTVLLYSPEVSKDDAPTIDLAGEPDLKIVEAIRPSALPLDVLEWLNPQQRLSYFFSVDDGKN